MIEKSSSSFPRPGNASSGAGIYYPSQSSTRVRTVSVRVSGGEPLVYVGFRRWGWWLCLDSIAGRSADLHPTTQGRSTGEGQTGVQSELVPDVTLEIGELRIPHRTVEMRPLGGCLLGTVLLDKFVTEIDYLTPAIHLYSAQDYLPPREAVSVPLMLDSSRRPMITGRLLLQSRDAVDARLLLDTAVANYALSLSKAFADRERIPKRVITLIHPPFRGEGTGGTIDLLATRIRRLSVGSVGMDEPILLLFQTRSGAPVGSQPDGLIGSGFLHRFLVAIDVPNRRLHLTPNRTYNDPEPRWPWASDLQLAR